MTMDDCATSFLQVKAFLHVSNSAISERVPIHHEKPFVEIRSEILRYLRLTDFGNGFDDVSGCIGIKQVLDGILDLVDLVQLVIAAVGVARFLKAALNQLVMFALILFIFLAVHSD